MAAKHVGSVCEFQHNRKEVPKIFMYCIYTMFGRWSFLLKTIVKIKPVYLRYGPFI